MSRASHKNLARPRHGKVAREAWKVLRALGRYERMGCGLKEVAKDTELPLRTVQRRVNELVRAGMVQSPFRGHYVHVPDAADILADPQGREGAHGLVLHGQIDARTYMVPLFGATDTLALTNANARYAERVEEWRGRLVRLRFFPTTRSFVVYVPASKLPIPWGEFPQFREWLAGRLYPLTIGAWKVVEIGLNVDYDGWRLEGIKGVTLDRLNGTVERFYQKAPGLVRHEVHDTRSKHTLDQVVKLLREGSTLSQYERALRMELDIAHANGSGNGANGGDPAKARREPASVEPSEAWMGGYA